jgi:redox-regulated HSP33 family molecular chaperone
MHIVCSGKEKLRSLVVCDVFINHTGNNIVVYTNVVGEDNMRNTHQIEVSEIKDGKFSLLSSTDCEVKWLVVEIDNNDNLRDYMNWHPMF